MTKVLLYISCTISIILSCNSLNKESINSQKNQIQKKTLYAITNVNIIPMTLDNKIIENASVLISGDKILSINKAIPDSAFIIDGKGKWLIPGLIDMHVHTLTDGHFNTNYPTRAAAIFTKTQDIMTPYIANGVTTIFDLNAMAGHFGQRNEILRGDVIGPRMALAAMINGGNGNGRIANTPSEGRQSVRLLKAEGYEFIKVYSQLDAETYKAIVDEASIQNMKVIGHIPNAFKGNIEQAFVSDFGMVAHAEEFFKQIEANESFDINELAQLVKANGTWVCPTLIVIESALEQGRSLEGLKKSPTMQYVHPLLQSKWITANNNFKNATIESLSRLEKMIEFNKRLVLALQKAGVPIVAGTDAGSSGVIWGFSLHDEIECLVEAGLSPEAALISATRLPSIWLSLDDKIGTVEAGKFADLLLLDANPLTNIKNTKLISGVFINGNWIDKSNIKSMLSDLSKRNASKSHNYTWSNRNKY